MLLTILKFIYNINAESSNLYLVKVVQFILNMTEHRKKALITGASEGIGNSIAGRLADLGYDLMLASRNTDKLADLINTFSAKHPAQHFTSYAADLTDKDAIKGLCQWALTARVDVLVNNLGLFTPAGILEEDDDDVEHLFHTNYFTAHHLCRTLGKQMKSRRNGHIVNITSTASRDPVKAGSYTVTKFALRGLTYVLREELRPFGVRVTEIVPGSTRTFSWEGSDIPVERFVTPQQIADAVAYCLSVENNALIEEIVIKPQAGNIISSQSLD